MWVWVCMCVCVLGVGVCVWWWSEKERKDRCHVHVFMRNQLDSKWEDRKSLTSCIVAVMWPDVDSRHHAQRTTILTILTVMHRPTMPVTNPTKCTCGLLSAILLLIAYLTDVQYNDMKGLHAWYKWKEQEKKKSFLRNTRTQEVGGGWGRGYPNHRTSCSLELNPNVCVCACVYKDLTCFNPTLTVHKFSKSKLAKRYISHACTANSDEWIHKYINLNYKYLS